MQIKSVPKRERIKINNYLIKLIIIAINGLKANGTNPANYEYLLNQIIREYIIPDNHWWISEAADKLWHSITNKNISQYRYRQKILCDKADGTQCVKKYTGNGNSFTTELVQNNSRHVFNSIFIAEHVIRVDEIIKQLVEISPLDCKTTRAILDKMHICRMLKEEERKLPEGDRGLNFDDIVKTTYYDVNIKLLGYPYSTTEISSTD